MLVSTLTLLTNLQHTSISTEAVYYFICDKANLDGRGDYDIIWCKKCKGNDNWIKCSHDPNAEEPNIVKRGTTNKAWFEKALSLLW